MRSLCWEGGLLFNFAFLMGPGLLLRHLVLDQAGYKISFSNGGYHAFLLLLSLESPEKTTYFAQEVSTTQDMTY